MNRMDDLFYTNLCNQVNAQAYCRDKKIFVYPVPKSQKEFYIEVENNGNITRSTKAYSTKEWSEKVCEIYVHYYKKYSK
jgi:hypothetical protein